MAAQGKALKLENKRPHYVYLIRDGDGRLKIGHSNSPSTRIHNLGTSASTRLTLEHQWKLPGRSEAVALERTLHRLLRWSRTALEWHALTTLEARSVGDAVLAGDAERAADLSLALRQTYVAEARSTELSRRLIFVRGAGARNAIKDEMAEVDDDLFAASQRAYALGLEPDELELWARKQERPLAPSVV